MIHFETIRIILNQFCCRS